MQNSKFRQGDVLLTPASPEKNSLGVKQVHLVLAHGEVTGHKHQITNGQAELYEKDGVLFLHVLSQAATLGHEEHKPIQIPCGTWMVQIQREYRPEPGTQIQYVSD